MTWIVGDNLSQIYRDLMVELEERYQHECAPRGLPIRELLASGFTLTDPRNRVIVSPIRAANYGFAVGELCWYLRGNHDLATMLYYNKRMSRFSDDGLTINSAYGERIYRRRWDGFEEPRSQFDNVVAELKRDPDSRRAVVHINEPSDLRSAVDRGSKDVPCTMSLQFFVRDRRLHMHVLMRSNDVVWGTPYDAFSFTCLQEATMLVLRDEGVGVDDLGSYHHSVGSLHLYGDHFGLAGDVAKEETEKPAPMSPFALDELEWVAHVAEPAIRRRVEIGLRGAPTSPSVAWMVGQLVAHRTKRDGEEMGC